MVLTFDHRTFQWFEEKTQEIECLENSLRKLACNMDGLVHARKLVPPCFILKYCFCCSILKTVEKSEFFISSFRDFRDLASYTGALARTTAMISNCEEHQQLALALVHLNDLLEKVIRTFLIDR